MFFQGFEKLDLVNFSPYMAVSVWLDGCNMRCPYCHNPSLVKSETNVAISEEEIFSYIKQRSSFIDAICISGGEAMLSSDLPEFLRRIRESTDLKIKLDTNLSLPSQLERLIAESLVDYIAGDIKTSFSKYSLLLPKGTNFVGTVENIKRSLKVLNETLIGFELRTTAVKEIVGLEDFPVMLEEVREIVHRPFFWYLQKFRNQTTLDENFKFAHGYDDVELEKIREEMEGCGAGIKFELR